uniref:Disks large-associated protein 5 n=1 Tax=Petromyzon marinus TaxID=7757 RepID=A0AAJ7UBE6_PETMA|nr:disks large-associated protein 5 [Petromyzon marinus]XP_032833351.1 disks large-associated protein 5 [Petromyzon marinus]XP_032833359.1 disks large-associated protein 5 [Petromyzon marinus]XP_032833367.1 disks large-associated protein 5 [Petromyzon marinus]
MMASGRGTGSGGVQAHAGLHKKLGPVAELRVRLAQEKAAGRRERRATILLERRRGYSPLAERSENVAPQGESGKPTGEQSSQLLRRERLAKYKEEKELRRRQAQSKKTFVVKHVKASPPRYLLSLPPGVTIAAATRPPAVAKTTTTAAKRTLVSAVVPRITTRSMARQQVPGMAGARHEPAPRTVAAQTRKAAPRVAAPAQEAKPDGKGRTVAGAGVTGRVTRLRAKEETVAAVAAPASFAARRGTRIAIKLDEVLHEEQAGEEESGDCSKAGEEAQLQPGLARSPEAALASSRRQGMARRSFAPVGFVFQGLPGMTTMMMPPPRLQPLSPCSTSSFLAPAKIAVSLSFSPMQHGPPPPRRPATPIALAVKAAEEACAPPGPEGQDGAPGVGDDTGAPCSTGGTGPLAHAGDVVAPVPAAAVVPPEAVGPAGRGEELHGVPYYRYLLRKESARLTLQCEKWEHVNVVEEVPEEMSGPVRIAVGMARLLMAERFRQFEGLVDDCDLGRGEKPTTLCDLAGFWDMVYFQVEDVNKKFAELENMQGAGWKEDLIMPPPRPLPARKKKAAAVAPRAPATRNDGARRAARERLAAFRAKAALARGAKGVEEYCVEAGAPLPPQQGEAPSLQQGEAPPTPQQGEATALQQGEAPPQQGVAPPLRSPTTPRGRKRSRGGSMTPSVTVAFEGDTPREARRPLRKTPRPAPVPPSPDTPDSPPRCCQVEPSPAESLASERDVDELELSISKYLVPSQAAAARTPERQRVEAQQQEGEEEEDAVTGGELLVPLSSDPGLLWCAGGSLLTTPFLACDSPLATASPAHLLTPQVTEERATSDNLIVFTPNATGVHHSRLTRTPPPPPLVPKRSLISPEPIGPD